MNYHRTSFPNTNQNPLALISRYLLSTTTTTTTTPNSLVKGGYQFRMHICFNWYSKLLDSLYVINGFLSLTLNNRVQWEANNL